LRVLLVAMLCLGCSRNEAPPAPQGPKKPRVDITVWLDREPEGDSQAAFTISTKTPPRERQIVDKSGVRLAVVGVPTGVDPAAFLPQQVRDAEAAGANATILVSARCLADLAPAIEKQIFIFQTVPLVIGPPCEAKVKPAIGTAMMLESGQASRVRISIDLHTHELLKVEPIH
jgi:hypothetical protein